MSERRGRRRRLAVGLTIIALGIFGVAVGASLPWGPDTRADRVPAAAKTATTHANPQASAPAATLASAQASAPSATTRRRKQMPRPVRIAIPAIDLWARVVPLGLNADGTLEVPVDFGDTGWFTEGPEPGEQGAAVVAGHVASRRGPAVFYRLRELQAGDMVTIHLKDGSTVRYVVRSMVRVPKSRFPTRRVYARTKEPTLRLITCAGKLNPSTGHHPDNYIVFASIVR